ncbi:uncharacterized protein METZ01_LOCUS500105 [marine metagenome]|uniref:Uncharacterized protein n=1 Tax=marine metagenome TaxID=408172 RepID=A0A383DRX2_9ZZZZ
MALSSKRRRKLPDKDFAFRKSRKYPIQSLKQAKLALSMGKGRLTASEYKYLRGQVTKRYPSLKSK